MPSTAVSRENLRAYVRTIGICGYGYIHGYPWIIHGWQISYPRQACLFQPK